MMFERFDDAFRHRAATAKLSAAKYFLIHTGREN